MKAGTLDRRWKLLEKVETTDDAGQPVVTWSTFDTVWGSWETVKGTEQWAARQFVEKSVARVRFRHSVGKQLTALNRIENDDLGQFEIIGEPEQKRREDETVVHVSRIVTE